MVTIVNPVLETCHPWTLHAWPTLLWQVGKQVPLQIRHLSTQISGAAAPAFRSAGQTCWAWRSDAGDVGMAWDWVEIGRGVLALADPMAVVTNLRLIGDQGTLLSPLQSAPHLNHMVHSLPWQDEVERMLGSRSLLRPDAGHRALAPMVRQLQ